MSTSTPVNIPEDIIKFEPDPQGDPQIQGIDAQIAEDAAMEVAVQEWGRRFILLEGTSNVAQKQNIAANGWGCNIPRTQWVIIDRQLEKFILVKVSLDYDKCIEQFNEKAEEMQGHASLVIINPENTEILNTCYLLNSRILVLRIAN